jgi:hypothetical protein
MLAAAILLPAGRASSVPPPYPDPTAPPISPPPPAPSPQHEPSEPAPEAEVPPPAEGPWVVPEELKKSLARQAEMYQEYALRFTCTETVRLARYGRTGEADDESTRRYAYLLQREEGSQTLRELRQRTRGDSTPRGDEVKDEEPFPPAYAWVFLFSSFHQPYFAYRDRGDRFEGFDWVREIDFRGALPFTDGKDIRQWQGTVLVDAVTYTPIEIHAEPSGQTERIKALFDRWSRAFNIMGMRLAPRPFGYRCRVMFHMRRDALTFPTQLRYDTFRAVGAKKNVPWQASIRDYEEYRFFKTSATESPVVPTSK